jgi:transposase
VRAALAVRDALVRTRARYISLIRALVRREGLRVRTGMARYFVRRLAELKLPEPLATLIAPLLVAMETLDREIDAADVRLAQHAENDPVVRRLTTVPSIGPVTALSFVATLDRVERFRGPHPAAAYLGLVSGERSSGEQQRRGPITKRLAQLGRREPRLSQREARVSVHVLEIVRHGRRRIGRPRAPPGVGQPRRRHNLDEGTLLRIGLPAAHSRRPPAPAHPDVTGPFPGIEDARAHPPTGDLVRGRRSEHACGRGGKLD